jgi:endonuclease YncB( thermonuclease family)
VLDLALGGLGGALVVVTFLLTKAAGNRAPIYRSFALQRWKRSIVSRLKQGMPILLLAGLAIAGALIPSSPAKLISGQAIIIDGDTIQIHGERLRILDIDAPERDQPCTRSDGSIWQCGQRASVALADRVGGQTVTCEAMERDRYGRWLAHCAAGGEDVARWLAGNGWAVPYRDCFCIVVRAVSAYAWVRNIGIWSGSFQMPWEWRRAN